MNGEMAINCNDGKENRTTVTGVFATHGEMSRVLVHVQITSLVRTRTQPVVPVNRLEGAARTDGRQLIGHSVTDVQSCYELHPASCCQRKERKPLLSVLAF
jgi:hypothetical protein